MGKEMLPRQIKEPYGNGIRIDLFFESEFNQTLRTKCFLHLKLFFTTTFTKKIFLIIMTKVKYLSIIEI